MPPKGAETKRKEYLAEEFKWKIAMNL